MGTFKPILLLVLVASLATFAVASAQGLEQAGIVAPPAATYGYARLGGELLVELFLSPPVTSPGETMTATIVASNHGRQAAAPELLLPIPEELAWDASQLPAGSSYDLVAHRLSWQPLLAPGQQRILALPFTVGVADLAQPVQQMALLLRQGERFEQAAATYWVGLPPQAAILESNTRPAVGQPVHLVARLGGTGPFHQRWELGDGRTLEAVDPEVVYATAGTYQVTLTVANLLAATQVTTTLTVISAPEAMFTPDDATPGVGQPVQFRNLSGGRPPLSYAWDFGDGATSEERDPVHAFSAPGEYRVSLNVKSGQQQATFVWPLTVAPAPSVEMLLPTSANSGDTVTGYASSGQDDVSFQWDMGDGFQLNGSQVDHRFLAGGDYYVTVTASNEYGQNSVGQWIAVAVGTELNLFLPALQAHANAAAANSLPSPVPANVSAISAARPYEQDSFEPTSLAVAPLPQEATAAEQLLWYINEARRLNGLPPLAYVHEMSVAAQRHTEDMATNQFTGHVGSDGSRPYDRLPRYGFKGKYAGEATAWGFDNARQVVEFWVNSPPHRRIILNPEALFVGVGFTEDYSAPNIWYWTAEYGEPPAKKDEG